MKKMGLILVILNTLAIAAVLGLFVYTKILFKRPAITETKERAKLEAAKKLELKDEKHVLVQMAPITVNLDPFTGDDGKQKVHYATLTLAVELSGDSQVAKFNEVQPMVIDKVIQNLGKKKFEDLNQVQGRYVFRSQVIDAANEFLGGPIVTDVFFSDFLLQ